MNTARAVVVGVDGGGTKTDLAVADLDGRTLARVRVGGTNHESVGLDRAMAELHRGVIEVLEAAGAAVDDVAASAFGLAGVDWPSDERSLDAAVAGFGLSGRRAICNDAAVALRAGASEGWGIVSSIGTGAVAAGVDPSGRWFRSMSVGWGEPCGATSLAADALHAVARAHHRTGPLTVLTERVLELLGVADVPSLFEGLSRRGARPDGRLAPVVVAAADDGDQVACRIVDDSADAHAAIVVGVADHLDLTDASFELVTSGGVHVAGGRFGRRFAQHVSGRCPEVRQVALTRPPVDGAVAMALDLVASRA